MKRPSIYDNWSGYVPAPPEIELRGYQSEAIEAVWSYFDRTTRGNPLIVAPTGCHAIDTGILMLDGTVKKVQDIKPGDLLLGPDSVPREVNYLCRGAEEMYSVTPHRGGEPFIVNGGHLLHLEATREGRGVQRESVNISVSDYLKKSKTWKHVYKLTRSSGVTFSGMTEGDMVDPWLAGALLGDGSTVAGVAITTMDKEIADEFSRISEEYGTKVKKYTKPDNLASTYCAVTARGAPNRMLDAVRSSGLSERCEDKFVPQPYLSGSVSVRRSILAGLLDTDGHLYAGAFDFISKSKQLSRGVAFLARSLGITASVSECRKGCQTGAVGTYFRVCLSGDFTELPFVRRVHVDNVRPRKQKKSPNRTGFTVDPIGVGYFYGFNISGDHLYLTDDFVIHHNSGKSMVLAGICHEAWKIDPGARIMMLTHVQELVEQNEAALKRYWPDAPVGVFSAGMKRKESESPILFGGVQSVCRAVDKIGQADLVIVDECHLIPKSGNGQYLSAFKALGSMRPNLRVIGLTATPFRTDSGWLHKGAGALFDDIVYDIPLLDLMNSGYISRVTSKGTKSHINVDGVSKVGGEFVGSQLEQAAMSGDNVADAVTEVVARGQSRKGWLFFASGKAHAEMIRDEVVSRGYSCAMVMGDTPKALRKQLIQDYKDQKLRAMVSVGVLTTGFDAPHVDLIALMRPTMSPGLHVQIVGRGLRLSPGKENCLVLDFAGNIERHGPLDAIRVKEPGEGEGEAPIKECPECQELVAAGVLVCPSCGFEFPPREVVKHESRPSYLAIISDDEGVDETPEKPKLAVSSIGLRRHQKAGKADSVCVTYRINMATDIREWLCFDHGDFMKRKAARVWKDLGGEMPAPETTDEALDRTGEIAAPSYIRVREGRWPEVTDRIFMAREPGEDDGDGEPSTIKLGDDDFDYGDIPF